MGFWIAALAASALVALALARPLALSRPVLPRAAHEERVFRDQLAEIDRDLERGVLDPEEAASARLEVSRRLLAAAAEREAAAGPRPAPKRTSLALAATLLVAAPLAALLLYRTLGAPDLPDQPLALRVEGVRPSQAAAEARVPAPPATTPSAEAAARLAELEAARETGTLEPADLFVLAQGYAALERHAEAWRAYAELIGERDDAPATLQAALGESMVLAAGGYVSPEAQAAFEAALRRDPAEPVARYYLGAALAQTRRPQAALEIWSRLLADSAADAPWRAAVQARIEELVKRTGLSAPEVAPRAPNPDARRDAILGMVERLDERLAREGGGPEEWARLVASWRALGLDDRAEAAEARAREALAGDAAALSALAAETALMDEAARLAETAPDVAAAEGSAIGPASEDVAAAAGMAPEDRAAMIRGMVDGLRDRLYAGGGDAEAWTRLVRSLVTLGRTEEAGEALGRGLAALGEDEAARLAEAARAAGLAVE